MLIRPIEHRDLEDFYALAGAAGVGVTTLPADRTRLEERISKSVQSFRGDIPAVEANYVFALEDPASGKQVGVSAIVASVGLDDVWYNYRVCESIHASQALDIRSQHQMLYLTNDLSGTTEVCSLLLSEAYRQGLNGRLLSKCRFLFMAEFPHLFNEKVIAEMRGFSDAAGESPFWASLGQTFFQMPFSRADYLVGSGNKAFIAELMPKFPIYSCFLSREAQEVIAQVHDNTRPALAMLEQEGFHYNGVVDIFDAGPIVEAPLANIRAVRESSLRQVFIEPSGLPEGPHDHWYLVSNRRFEGFRVVLLPESLVRSDTISIPQDLVEYLQVGTGDAVRVLPLRYKRGKEQR